MGPKRVMTSFSALPQKSISVAMETQSPLTQRLNQSNAATKPTQPDHLLHVTPSQRSSKVGIVDARNRSVVLLPNKSDRKGECE